MEVSSRLNAKTTSGQVAILTWGSGRPQGPGALEPGCIVLPRLAAASSTHAPGWRGSATRPRGADQSSGLPARSPEKALGRGWGRGSRDPHSHRLPSAGGGQRGLIISPGICPPQPPIRLLRTPSARCRSREAPPTSPFRPPRHSPAPKAFVLAATRITIPEEEVPGLLVAPQHRVRQRSRQPRHLRVPHTPRALCPLTRPGDRTRPCSPHTAGPGSKGAAAPARDRHGSLR